MPMALWPHGIDLDNLATAWNRVHIDRYFVNTLVIAAGSWLVQIVVATTGGYALSVLRPRYAPIITGLVLATLFVPAVVLLVPLYLTILDMPLLHASLINTLLGGVAAGRRERLQRHHRQALLRQPAAGGVRGGAHGWRRSVPAVLVDRAAHVPAGPGGGLRVRGHRDLEGLPVAAAGAARPRRSSRCRCACRRSSAPPSWTCSWPRWPSRRSSPSPSSSSCSASSCAAAGLGGAVKG